MNSGVAAFPKYHQLKDLPLKPWQQAVSTIFPNTLWRTPGSALDMVERNRIAQQLTQAQMKGLTQNPIVSKLAFEEEPLKDYQRRVVQRISRPDQPGLVVAHSTGTGKTRSSIEAMKRLGLQTDVVVPAALKENYRKELRRWAGGVPPSLNLASQQQVARQGLHDPNSANKLLILDEAHRAREHTSKLVAALKEQEFKKKLLLTATPIFNHPTDLATLVNYAANKPLLPQDKAEFNRQYVGERTVNPNWLQRLFGVKPGVEPMLKNREQLGGILRKYVDYQPAITKGFPSFKEETVRVPMAPNQQHIYAALMGRAPWWMRWKVKAGLPPGKGELEKMRAFLSGARQVSNTTAGFVRDPAKADATKIQQAFQFARQKMQDDPTYKAVVYSNYLKSGLDPYKQQLAQANIPFGEFSGAIGPAERNKLVADYNANKLKALLISSAGAEGLDLKGTRLIQLLDPHFNVEKEKQIMGRGIRYGSHAGLPPWKQNVLVQRYLSQPQPTLTDRLLGVGKDLQGADEYIHNLALRKQKLTQEIVGLLDEEQKKKTPFLV